MAEAPKWDSNDSLLDEVEYRRLLQFGKHLVDASDKVQSIPTSTDRQHAFDDSTIDTDFKLSGSDTSIRADTLIDGRYRLVRPIADGGMGTVWLARQTQPVKRDLAIKLIKPGLNSHQVLERFDAERQSLAMMNHTNIARIINAGTTGGGQPFFAMELVEGLPFTKYCDKNRLSVNQRLQLFCDVCAGVQHAHQKGIIHRDLKPSNILVAEIMVSSGKRTNTTYETSSEFAADVRRFLANEPVRLRKFARKNRAGVVAAGLLITALTAGIAGTSWGWRRGRWIRSVRLICNLSTPNAPGSRNRWPFHEQGGRS